MGDCSRTEKGKSTGLGFFLLSHHELLNYGLSLQEAQVSSIPSSKATHTDMDMDILHRNCKNFHHQNHAGALSPAVTVFLPHIQQSGEKLRWSSRNLSFFKNTTGLLFFFLLLKTFRVKMAQFGVFFMHVLLQTIIIRRLWIWYYALKLIWKSKH